MAVAKSLRAILLGSPIDPAHQPDAFELYQKLTEMEGQSALDGALFFEDTLSDLNAASGPVEGDTGFVLDDSTASNNGVYRRGSVSWSKTSDLPGAFSDSVGALAAVAVEQARAEAAEVGLASDISGEATLRSSADATEAAARIAADAGLQTQIDSKASAAGLTAETAAREAADVKGDTISLTGIGGSGDAVTASIPAAQAHITPTTGTRVIWQQPATNTGDVTMTIGATAYGVRSRSGAVLPVGALVAGEWYMGVQHAADRIRVLSVLTAADVVETTGAKVMTAAERTKLAGIEAGSTANASDSALRDRATHTGAQAISTVTGLQAALDGKAEDANLTTEIADRTAGDAANANAISAHAGRTDNPHIVTKSQVGLGNADNTSDADKPISTATQAALTAAIGAEADARDMADVVEKWRPGEDTALWSQVTAGAPEGRAPVAVGTVTINADGAMLRITGSDIDGVAGYGDFAPRAAFAMETDRVYQARAVVRRAVDPVDPLGHGIELRARNLGADKSAVSTVALADAIALEVADGRVEIAVYVCRGTPPAGVTVYAPPVSARYMTPFVRIYGNGAETDIEALEWRDVTDSLTLAADLASVDADLTAEAAARVAGDAANADTIAAHAARADNPHAVTKAQVGLSAVDNTSDAAKPLSIAAINALAATSAIRLVFSSGDGDAAVYDVPAALSAVAISTGTLVHMLWPGSNTVTTPTVTFGGQTYTITRRDGGALAAGDLGVSVLLGRVYSNGPSYMMRLIGAEAIGDITGLQAALDLKATVADLNAEIATRESLIIGAGARLTVGDPRGYTLIEVERGGGIYTDAAQIGIGASLTLMDALGYVGLEFSNGAVTLMGGAEIHGGDRRTFKVMDPRGYVGLDFADGIVQIMGGAEIHGGDRRTFKVMDPRGYVGLDFSDGTLQIMGGAHIMGGDRRTLAVVDRNGFVGIEFADGALNVMGRPILHPEDAEAARTGILRRAPTDLLGWRAARGNMLAGQGRARILCLGDSNTCGDGIGPGVRLRSGSYPTRLGQILNRVYGATADGFCGNAGILSAADQTYDPRVAFGAGWFVSGAVSIGGTVFSNSTTTNPMTFTPNAAWDTCEVVFTGIATGEVDLSIGGLTERHTISAGSMVSVTYDAGSLGGHTLNIARAGGEVHVAAILPHSTTVRGVEVINAGRTGWKTSDLIDTTNFYSPGNALAEIGADLVLIEIGLNDFNTDVDPAVFGANLQTIIDLCPAGANVAIMSSVTPDQGARAYLWAEYLAQMDAVAADNGLPFIDMTAAMGDRTAVEGAGLTNDGLHPNYAGLAEKAHVVAKLFTF